MRRRVAQGRPRAMCKLLCLNLCAAGVDGSLVLGVYFGGGRLEASVESVVEGSSKGFSCALGLWLVFGVIGAQG